MNRLVDLEAPGTKMLLIHGGELADVRELLDELGLGFEEARPRALSTEDYLAAALVIATPQFLSNRLNAGEVGAGIRIAVIEDQAKTLLAMLSRGGVEWFVRRPFHPTALRLLLLHCLYQGPEKRKAQRVSVGAAVHYQAGWRKRGALLAEISERDCRILSSRRVDVGKRLKLRLPGELAGRRVLTLAGRVVRTAQGRQDDGSHEICILFDPLEEAARQRLKDLVALHSRGPAMLSGPAARHLSRNRASDPEEDVRVRRSVISCSGDDDDSQDGGASESPLEERRTDSRHEYRRRVIALSQEATRVLVGRDISRNGMRVESTPSLTLGSELQIALHVPGHETPLVVDVRVHRDDGERGLVLHFVDLPETGASYLEQMLGALPGLANASGDHGPEAFVVSEIVGGDTPSPG